MLRFAAFLFGLLIASSGAWAQQPADPPLPVLTYVLTQIGTASLSASTSSSRVSLGSAASVIFVTNTGNQPVCIALGDVTVIASITNCPTSVMPGRTGQFGMTSNTYLAGITASGTSTLSIVTGYTTPSAGGGPITGTVTANQGTAAAVGSAWPVTLAIGGALASATNPSPITFGTGVVLPAGTNLLGKVGIDQTTPGTTNGVQVNAALPAGTAILGKVGVDQTTPGSTNGVTIAPSSAAAVGIAPVVSTAAESNHVLKASAGNLYGLTAAIGATSGYVMIFDATSAPVDGAVTPKYCFPVNSNGTNGGIAVGWKSPPAAFATGITVVFSSTGCFTKTASATASFFVQAQ